VFADCSGTKGFFPHKFVIFLILMAPGDETDSGLESLSSSNKSLATADRKDSKVMRAEIDDDDIDDEVGARLLHCDLESYIRLLHCDLESYILRCSVKP